MALLSLQDVSIGFRGPNLLDGVSCQFETGDRVGLLGRNGAGKSTLLRLIQGEVSPDHGRVIRAPGIQVAYLQQDLPVGFGVLTVDSIEQAIERAGTKAGNKGVEATLSALEMASLLRGMEK